MKTIKFKFIALLIAVSAITACSIDSKNDNYCFSQGFVATQTVAGPETAVAGVAVPLDVTFTLTNSCQTFNGFVADATTTNPLRIGVLVDKTGCTCTDGNTTATKTYTFQQNVPGTYVLQFITADTNAPIVKTIVVTAQ